VSEPRVSLFFIMTLAATDCHYSYASLIRKNEIFRSIILLFPVHYVIMFKTSRRWLSLFLWFLHKKMKFSVPLFSCFQFITSLCSRLAATDCHYSYVSLIRKNEIFRSIILLFPVHYVIMFKTSRRWLSLFLWFPHKKKLNFPFHYSPVSNSLRHYVQD
jgi:hypothetical protein